MKIKNKVFKLTKYQSIPIDHLTKKCKKQHGLIINHFMGSGKTFLGISFLTNFPERRKVVICPENLKNIWTSYLEDKENKVENWVILTTREIYFFSKEENFEKFSELMKDSVVVVDEAHSLYLVFEDMLVREFIGDDDKKLLIKNNTKGNRFISFMNIFMKDTYKILLMTGTLSTNHTIDSFSNVRFLINIAAGKNVVPFNKESFILKYKKVSIMEQFYSRLFKPAYSVEIFDSPLFRKYIGDDVKRSSSFPEVFLKSIQTISSSFIIKSVSKALELDNQISFKMIFRNPALIPFSKFMLLFVLKKYIPTLLGISKNIIETLFLYEEADFKRMKKENIGRYFSYYTFLENEDIENYPKVCQKIKVVDYTEEQAFLLLKTIIAPENIEDREYKYLEIFESEEKASILKNYKNFYNIYSTNKLKIISSLYEEPEKFKKITQEYRKNKLHTAVYSEFKSVISYFSKYLTKQNLKHVVISSKMNSIQITKALEDFKRGKVKLLLLEPEFYEGVSIEGCRVLHILEPVASFFKRQQLVSRVVRYKSHDSLIKSKRNVVIYTWVANLMRRYIESNLFVKRLHYYLDSEIKTKSVLELLDFTQEIFSPDMLVYKKSLGVSNFYKSIDQGVRSMSIESELR